MTKRLFVVTSAFPYGKGEQFLETEMQYYPEGTEVTLLPRIAAGRQRALPPSVRVDRFLAENAFVKNRWLYVADALRDGLFYKELFSEHGWSAGKLKIFLSAIYQYRMYLGLFDRYLRQLPSPENAVFYTYWHNVAAYALQTLKARYGFTLVSRIHRGDLYRSERPFGYMPLKSHFTKNLDALYIITPRAKAYLKRTYGFDESRLHLARLGVRRRGIETPATGPKRLHVVSCSFLSDVKRVDCIIDALAIAAKKQPAIDVKWTHLGDGPLREALEAQAVRVLAPLENVSWRFAGSLSNDEVFAFYRDNEADLFLNTSRSEGVPVSMMEAMSCRITVAGPDVGGITDMIEDGISGRVLPEVPAAETVASVLAETAFFKRPEVREASYRIFLRRYDAAVNYPAFAEEILTIKENG